MWVPAAAMLAVSLISYVDRHTLALLAPTILKETGLSAEQYGFIISCFSVAYMIGNPVWGHWLDRFGLRGGMLAAVGFWTAASVSHAFVSGFSAFAIARVALGFGEGATFPGALRTVMQTLPERLRNRGIALSYSGGSLGAIVTPIVITPVAVLWGWRGAFWFTGLVGLAWLAMWIQVSRREEISSATAISAPGAVVIRFTDLRVWSCMGAYALGALPLGFVLYVTSIYLSKVYGKSQIEIGSVLWIPPLGWEIGYFIWGWIADRCGRTIKSFRLLFAACTLLSLPLAAAPAIHSYAAFLSFLFFATFVSAGFIILPVSYANRIFPASQAGLIAGLTSGSWSAVVAVLMQLFGRLFDQQRYFEAFGLATCCPIIGYLFWLAVNRPRRR
jgi:ACS family hexuronate transporter-like MFS transporter